MTISKEEFISFSRLLTDIYIYLLAKDATFYIGRRQNLKDTFSFGLIHQGWYLTASDKVGSDSWKTMAAYDNKTNEFALESSFVVVPYSLDNPYINCETIGPQKPEQPEVPPGIPGQPPSIPGQPPPQLPSPPVVPGQPSYPPGPPGSNYRPTSLIMRRENYFF